MGMMALRLPDRLKKEMSRIKINWSDYLRNSIAEIIESNRKQALLQRIHALGKGHKKVKAGTAEQLIRSIRDNA